MKKAFALLAAFVVAAASHAADTKPIEDVFQRYWAAYAKQDYFKAAAEILPADLEATKNAVLPVFLGAQTHQDKEVQAIVGAFFGRTVGKARDAMSAADVYAGLNRVVAAGDPQMFEAIKQATTSIIFVRTPAADEAEVHFQVSVRGQSDTDAEGLVRKNGRWWVRAKDEPAEVAAQFKQMFGRK